MFAGRIRDFFHVVVGMGGGSLYFFVSFWWCVCRVFM